MKWDYIVLWEKYQNTLNNPVEILKQTLLIVWEGYWKNSYSISKY